MVTARCLAVAALLMLGARSPAGAQQAPAHATPGPSAQPSLSRPADCVTADEKSDSPGHAAAAPDPRTARLCRYIDKQAYRISLLEKKIALLQKP